jgi:hypothetical protein
MSLVAVAVYMHVILSCAIYELEKVVKKEDLCGRLQPKFDRTEVL